LEDIRKHQQRSPEEIFAWLEGLNAFLNTFQTDEDRARTRLLKNKKTWLSPKELEDLRREMPLLFKDTDL
jgi:hypothetical protein